MCRFIIVKKRTLIICLIAAVLTVTCGVCLATGLTASCDEEAPQQGVRLPILMYHSILKNPFSAGKYVVSPDTFEADMKYLKDNGYTCVLSDDVIGYVKNGQELPEKSVMVTLDDGYLNNLTYVVPILEKYDMKAVISIVGEYTERFSAQADHNPNYSHFSWTDIDECIKSGRVEIGNHTYNMHKQDKRRGSMKKRSESREQYEKAFSEDVMKTQQLLKQHCGIEPKIFTYPYGAVSNDSLDLVKKLGFEMSLGCCEKVNVITRNEEDLYQLCRFNRPSGISTEKFMAKIEK